MLEIQRSTQQGQRECLPDNNQAIYGKLNPRLGKQTLRDPFLMRPTTVDTYVMVGALPGLQDSQSRSPERETSLDLCQTFIDQELTIVDSDPQSNHDSLATALGAVDSQMRNHLSLSVEDSQKAEAGLRALLALDETLGQQDGVHTTAGALGEVVRVCTFNLLCSDGTRKSAGNQYYMQ